MCSSCLIILIVLISTYSVHYCDGTPRAWMNITKPTPCHARISKGHQLLSERQDALISSVARAGTRTSRASQTCYCSTSYAKLDAYPEDAANWTLLLEFRSLPVHYELPKFPSLLNTGVSFATSSLSFAKVSFVITYWSFVRYKFVINCQSFARY